MKRPAHVIELRDFGRHFDRVMVRQADHGSAEGEILGARHEAGHEHQWRGNGLGGRGEMLAEPQFVEAEPVGIDRLLVVLGERVGERTSRRMHRHHEQSEAHSISSNSNSVTLRWPQSGPRRATARALAVSSFEARCARTSG
jgi:hypothetical protein